MNVSIPKVIAWSSRASESPVHAEYIFMERQTGVTLSDVWDNLKGKQKVQILDQVVDIERRLASVQFTKFGALYYIENLPEGSDSSSPLYRDSTGGNVWS